MSKSSAGTRVSFDGFRKRAGHVVAFSRAKIEDAIQHAVEAAARSQGQEPNAELAGSITSRVIEQLNAPTSEYYVYAEPDGQRIPNIEDVQDLVEILLAESGETMIVATYKRYRKRRDTARKRIRVRGTVLIPLKDRWLGLNGIPGRRVSCNFAAMPKKRLAKGQQVVVEGVLSESQLKFVKLTDCRLVTEKPPSKSKTASSPK